MLQQLGVARAVCLRELLLGAQVKRWQSNDQSAGSAVSGRKRDRSSIDDRPELHLTLNSLDQLAAAEAVIASLYAAKQPLQQLSAKQLVHAVVLAETLQLSAAAEVAMAQLQADISSKECLSLAAVDVLCSLQAWPSCLLPVVVT